MPTKQEDVEASDVLTQEQKEAAAASASRATELRKEEGNTDDKYPGGRRLHRKGSGPTQDRDLKESDIPYPAEVHGKDFELMGPSGFATRIPQDVDIVAFSGDQEFEIIPERVEHLLFDKPGRALSKQLYVIKALMPDGRLVQLPFEQQIQNNAGGDPADAIGLRRYQRKGIKVLIDFDTLVPVYCAALDCWAQAAADGDHIGFCSARHAKYTLPNQYKDAGTIVHSIFGENATTSRTWAI